MIADVLDKSHNWPLEFLAGGLDGNTKFYANIIALVAAAIVLAKVYGKSKVKTKPAFYDKTYVAPKIMPVEAGYQWNKVPFLKSYPFKDAEYKLTMGIKRLDPNDWLLVEPTYMLKITEKTKLVTNNHPEYDPEFDLASRTIFVTPECEPAIREFYDMVVDFLCKRYPMHFSIEGDQMYNNITKEYVPLRANDITDARDYLLYLTRTIEEDVIFMIKDTQHQEPEDEYYFKGGIFAFAAGFDPLDKFNQPLTSIHKPIPGYEEKLKTSMNRFFNRINPGQFVNRNNFSVQTHTKLFVHNDNKGYHLTEVVPMKLEDLDFDNQVHYRSERQVLTRLPKSGAVIFTLKTYLVPLSQVKNEGPEVSGRLAGALEKFPEDIKRYKNAVTWGEAVCSYLRL